VTLYRKVSIVVGTLAALIIVIWLGVEARNQTTDASAEPWFFELAVDLQVDGQPIKIQRVIECQPIWREAPGLEATQSFYPRRYLTSARLPGGSGVMVVNPNVCRRNTPVEFGYDPLILWTDSADNPNVIEAYYDPDALKQGSGRVKLVSIDVKAPTAAKAEPEPQDFIDWAGGVGRLAIPEGERLRFSAVYAVEVPAVLWEADERIREALEQIVEAGAVEPPLVGWLSSAFPSPTDRPFIDTGFYPSVDYSSLDEVVNRPLRMRDVIPLRIAANRLETDFSSRGTLVFYRLEQVMRFTTGKGPEDAVVAGATVSGNRGAGSYVWLPANRRLFLLRDGPMSFVLHPE
jgi:hypothetical protein